MWKELNDVGLQQRLRYMLKCNFDLCGEEVSVSLRIHEEQLYHHHGISLFTRANLSMHIQNVDHLGVEVDNSSDDENNDRSEDRIHCRPTTMLCRQVACAGVSDTPFQVAG